MNSCGSIGLHGKDCPRRKRGDFVMTGVLAAITTSIDGYVAGPEDGPGKGLGEGGERLHYWVFGGPWRYDEDRAGRRQARMPRGWSG